MRYRFITVPARDAAAAEEELNGFLASHRIVAIEKQWLASEQNPAWCFVITYENEKSNDGGRRGAVDYKEVLDDDDFQRFAQLRARTTARGGCIMSMGVCQAKGAVLRGGSWNDNGKNLRSAYRNHDHRDNAGIIGDNNGFRLARAHVATGWRIKTRQHPVMAGACPSCKQQGRRGVSNRRESPLSGRPFQP